MGRNFNKAGRLQRQQGWIVGILYRKLAKLGRLIGDKSWNTGGGTKLSSTVLHTFLQILSSPNYRFTPETTKNISSSTCERMSKTVQQSVALTCDHSAAFLARRCRFSHTGISLDMGAACVEEQGRPGEPSPEHCHSSRETTALSGCSTFLRNHAAAQSR